MPPRREVGIETRLMNAVRTFIKKRNRTIVTMIAPSRSARFRL